MRKPNSKKYMNVKQAYLDRIEPLYQAFDESFRVISETFTSSGYRPEWFNASAGPYMAAGPKDTNRIYFLSRWYLEMLGCERLPLPGREQDEAVFFLILTDAVMEDGTLVLVFEDAWNRVQTERLTVATGDMVQGLTLQRGGLFRIRGRIDSGNILHVQALAPTFFKHDGIREWQQYCNVAGIIYTVEDGMISAGDVIQNVMATDTADEGNTAPDNETVIDCLCPRFDSAVEILTRFKGEYDLLVHFSTKRGAWENSRPECDTDTYLDYLYVTRDSAYSSDKRQYASDVVADVFSMHDVCRPNARQMKISVYRIEEQEHTDYPYGEYIKISPFWDSEKKLQKNLFISENTIPTAVWGDYGRFLITIGEEMDFKTLGPVEKKGKGKKACLTDRLPDDVYAAAIIGDQMLSNHRKLETEILPWLADVMYMMRKEFGSAKGKKTRNDWIGLSTAMVNHYGVLSGE